MSLPQTSKDLLPKLEPTENDRSPLVLGHHRLRFDPNFTWVLGGRVTQGGAIGNGQPPSPNTAGLWYSPTRPHKSTARLVRVAP